MECAYGWWDSRRAILGGEKWNWNLCAQREDGSDLVWLKQTESKSRSKEPHNDNISEHTFIKVLQNMNY